MRFSLLYPERRIVSGEKILSWYRDAVANGEVKDMGGNVLPEQAAAVLQNAGLITISAVGFDR